MKTDLKTLARVGAEVQMVDLLKKQREIERQFPGAIAGAKKRLDMATLETARAVGAAKAASRPAAKPAKPVARKRVRVRHRAKPATQAAAPAVSEPVTEQAPAAMSNA